MYARSQWLRPAGALLAALFCSCSDSAEDPAYPQYVGYREDGQIVVYTPAGIMFHGAELSSEQASIELDAHVGGVLKDEPFDFAAADNGRVAAVGFSNTSDRDVEVYDLATRKVLLRLDLDGDPSVESAIPVQNLLFDPEGELLYIGADSWGVYAVETGERLWGADASEFGPGGTHLFSRDGTMLFGFEGDRGERFVARQARTGELIYSVDGGGEPGSYFSSKLVPSGVDGILLEARRIQPPSGEGARQAYVFRSERDGSVIKELPQFPERQFGMNSLPQHIALTCAASGEVCATALNGLGRWEVGLWPEDYIAIWSSDGTLLRELPGFAGSLAFSPDGSELAVAGAEAQVYRVADGALLGRSSYTYQGF